jgi:hypothetical protein
MIGYFQTCLFAETVKDVVNSNAKNILKGNKETLELHRESKVSSPLIIHIRRSDYQNDSNFGLLTADYYLNVMDKNVLGSNPIWVFSDDIELARTILAQIESRVTRWISEVDNSAAMSMFAMSFGEVYVIANSTFSWWGAYLSEKSEVFYPESWLRGIPHRGDLFPVTWIPNRGEYE